MTHQKNLEIAKAIIEEMIHYDQWRDNLHPNDFPYTRNKIATALDTLEKETIERCAKVAEGDYVFGKDCPIDQFKGWRLGAEQARVSIAQAIRNLKKGQGA
jgi:hypothetical protein